MRNGHNLLLNLKRNLIQHRLQIAGFNVTRRYKIVLYNILVATNLLSNDLNISNSTCIILI